MSLLREKDNMVQYMDEELIASENVGQWWWWWWGGGDRQHASIHRGWNPIIAETSWIERYQWFFPSYLRWLQVMSQKLTKQLLGEVLSHVWFQYDVVTGIWLNIVRYRLQQHHQVQTLVQRILTFSKCSQRSHSGSKRQTKIPKSLYSYFIS